MSGEGPVGFDYAGLVMEALRGVVREVLRKVERDGLLGDQHFYVSFRTTAPDLELPALLRKQFPEEMTIVLQNQFWGLAVEDSAFSVQLRFAGKLERLRVPFAALVSFADPSVPFGLRFEASAEAEPAAAAPPVLAETEPAAPSVPGGASASKVVAFRSDRKKTGPKRVGS